MLNDPQQYRSRLQAYLLRQSPAEESERLESEFFENDDLFALLLQAEEELIERFERGQLSRDEQRAFRSATQSSPRLRDLLEVQRRLAPQPPARKPRPWQRSWPMAVAASVLVVLSLLASWRIYVYKIKISPRTVFTAGESKQSPAATLTAQLNSPGLRGGNNSYTGTAIAVAPGIRELILLLPPGSVPSGARTFSIRSADNPAPVLKGEVALNNQKQPLVRIPNLLPPNDYIVTIFSGKAPVADFYFRLNFSN